MNSPEIKDNMWKCPAEGVYGMCGASERPSMGETGSTGEGAVQWGKGRGRPQ